VLLWQPLAQVLLTPLLPLSPLSLLSLLLLLLLLLRAVLCCCAAVLATLRASTHSSGRRHITVYAPRHHTKHLPPLL
jgi:hypothetical protein